MCDNSIGVSLPFFSPHSGACGGPNVILCYVFILRPMHCLPRCCQQLVKIVSISLREPLHSALRRTIISDNPESFAKYGDAVTSKSKGLSSFPHILKCERFWVCDHTAPITRDAVDSRCDPFRCQRKASRLLATQTATTHCSSALVTEFFVRSCLDA